MESHQYIDVIRRRVLSLLKVHRLAALLVIAALPTVTTYAQDPSENWAPVVGRYHQDWEAVEVAQVPFCDCGSWTCPICQRGCDCDLPHPPSHTGPLYVLPPTGPGPAIPAQPSTPSAPGTPSVPRAPSAPAAPGTPQQGPLTPAPGLPSADEATAAGTSARSGLGNIPPISSLAASQSAVRGGPGIPGMIADAFGGAGGTESIVTDITVVPFRFQASGFLLNGSPFQPGSPMLVEFDAPGGVSPVDFFSEGVGIDADGDGEVDTVNVAEPVAPTDAPTAPGPGFTYDGGTARNLTRVWDGTDTYDVQYSYSARQPYTLILPSPGGPGGGVVVGRLKIAENNSPLPRHRIFINYSLFDNVPLVRGGVTVNRFSPGFETTFLDDQASFELRAPFATTLGSTILVDGPVNMGHLKWGDVFMALKFLLYETQQHAASIGMAMTLPIADDLEVRTVGGRPLVTIENESVHLMPFVGWLSRSPNGFFTQGFAQLDFDANGNTVAVNADGRGLVPVGRVQDTTYLQTDWGVGYLHWVTPGRFGRLIRVVPTLELHYTRSLERTDFVQTRDFRIGQGKGDVQLLNFVVGSTFDFANNSAFTVGYVAPIGYSSDQLFDGELRAFWNRYF